jgi:hypothetical protein
MPDGERRGRGRLAARSIDPNQRWLRYERRRYGRIESLGHRSLCTLRDFFKRFADLPKAPGVGILWNVGTEVRFQVVTAAAAKDPAGASRYRRRCRDPGRWRAGII